MKGTIKKLTDKNFGFIAREEGNDLFFHANNLVNVDFNSLQEGDTVEFEVIDTEKGQAASEVNKM